MSKIMYISNKYFFIYNIRNRTPLTILVFLIAILQATYGGYKSVDSFLLSVFKKPHFIFLFHAIGVLSIFPTFDIAVSSSFILYFAT
jgi:hypothetical protein